MGMLTMRNIFKKQNKKFLKWAMLKESSLKLRRELTQRGDLRQ